MKRLLCLSALVALAGCGPSVDDIDKTVQSSIQNYFDTNADWQQVGIKVAKVVAVQSSGNNYSGVVSVTYPGGDSSFSVAITADGNNIIWNAPPGSLASLAAPLMQVKMRRLISSQPQ
jgi:hypothetical protein